MIYLDNAATTSIDPSTLDLIQESLKKDWANPSATYQEGQHVAEKLRQAREKLAKILAVDPHEIIFTSGATEGTNAVFYQVAKQYKSGHVITSNVEHSCVRANAERLASLGFEVTYLPVNEEGIITSEQVQAALREDTRLVSLMTVNNETGVIFPIREIGEILAEHPCYFHTDAVQSVSTVDWDFEGWHVDFATFSAHKFRAPKGVGILYVKDPARFSSLLVGGGQESGHRAGTENVPYIVGMAHSLEITRAHLKDHRENYQALTDYLLEKMDEQGIRYRVNGSRSAHSPHILNLYLPGKEASQWLILADLAGIMISAGSACSAGSLKPSPVLTAMFGEGDERLLSSVRISFGLETSREDLDHLIDVFKKGQRS
ncbi:cysteine desulfurase [Atopobacter sp. AH10]|uniref:cysteine desulfurase family protein n=1 Tax=Atopobacter sp. AH10 TaxID=2315861 RepID=UPI000EF20A0A|nr:cysteine desulfurase family protein [Atopobacter sp. AH10]RLK62980.1 cysteine desulfurase [Atopobacter sp. AH10]